MSRSSPGPGWRLGHRSPERSTATAIPGAAAPPRHARLYCFQAFAPLRRPASAASVAGHCKGTGQPLEQGQHAIRLGKKELKGVGTTTSRARQSHRDHLDFALPLRPTARPTARPGGSPCRARTARGTPELCISRARGPGRPRRGGAGRGRPTRQQRDGRWVVAARQVSPRPVDGGDFKIFPDLETIVIGGTQGLECGDLNAWWRSKLPGGAGCGL